jgi:hypothetical protein
MSGQFPPAETFVFDIVCTNKGQHKHANNQDHDPPGR